MLWSEMSHKEQLVASHYDFYKSVHGIRPRWMNYDAMTVEELEKAMDDLAIQADEQAKFEAATEAANIKAFELKIDGLMSMGAKSREQAIEWIKQSLDTTMEENDYTCYLLGLPYGYIK